MAITSKPMQSREVICAAYTAADAQDAIKLNLLLDIRDLLKRLSVTAMSEQPEAIINDPIVEQVVKEDR